MEINPLFQESESLSKSFSWIFPNGKGNSLQGQFRGNSTGVGMDFDDFRPYQPGDDLRFIRWEYFARSRELVTTLFKKDIEPQIFCLLDTSPSMGYDPQKRAFTLSLFQFVVQSLKNSGFLPKIFFNRPSPPGPFPGKNFDHANHFTTLKWEESPLPAHLLSRAAPRLVFTDLLFEVPPNHFFSKLSKTSALTLILQIVAEEEGSPESGGYYLIKDVETGESRKIWLTPHQLEDLQQRRARHFNHFNQSAQSRGIAIFPFDSSQTLLHNLKKTLLPAGCLKF